MRRLRRDRLNMNPQLNFRKHCFFLTFTPYNTVKKIIITLILIAVSMTGCGRDTSRPADLPPLFPCTITITQDGNPLSGATVDLEPADGANTNYRASAITDESGRAVLTTYGYKGAPAGRYKVTVRKTLIENVGEVTNEYGEVVGSSGLEYRTVERMYSDAKTTPHEIEVTTGRDTTHATFDVGKPIKEKK